MSFRRCHSTWKPKNLKQLHLWRYLGHEYQRFLGMLHRTPLCGQMSLRDSCRFLQCQLCPDITGEAALQADVGSTTGIVSGAFVRGTRYQNTVNGLRGVPSYALKIEASSSNSTFGRNYSEVSVSAAYSLIIIKA